MENITVQIEAYVGAESDNANYVARGEVTFANGRTRPIQSAYGETRAVARREFLEVANMILSREDDNKESDPAS